MNKDQLQQELLEKIKQGVKPSGLKKSKNNNGEKGFGLDNSNFPLSHQKNNTPASSPPASPVIVPVDKQIKPEKKEVLTSPNKLKQLQEQVNFHANTAQTYLTSLQATMARLDQAEERIKELQSQPNQLSQETEQALKEANQKIREQEKTIQNLQNQTKTPTNTKPQTFLCSHCQQEWSQEFLRLINPQNQKTCADCLNNMLELTKKATGKEIVIEEQTKPQPTLKPCQFCRQPRPATSLKPRHIKNLPNKDPREITLLCQDCLIYRAIKADYYCPLTSEGRDTYEGNEFDCYCSNERRTL